MCIFRNINCLRINRTATSQVGVFNSQSSHISSQSHIKCYISSLALCTADNSVINSTDKAITRIFDSESGYGSCISCRGRKHISTNTRKNLVCIISKHDIGIIVEAFIGKAISLDFKTTYLSARSRNLSRDFSTRRFQLTASCNRSGSRSTCAST